MGKEGVGADVGRAGWGMKEWQVPCRASVITS